MKLKLRDKIYILLIIGTLAFVGGQRIYYSFIKNEVNNEAPIQEQLLKISDKKIRAIVLNTPETRYRGLSKVEKIGWDEGVLFLHEESAQHAYVMRDMFFDLDFIFIQDDQVVDIARSVSNLYRGEIKGATPYNKVLEMNSDWVRQNDIQIGDKVEFL